jgi:predicted dehydrogenase
MTMRVGILGFAHGHVGMYCGQWAKMDGVKVVAGWDHDAERLANARKQFGIDTAGSAKELCGRGDIDAVVIGAETSLHAEMVEAAASAGKSVVLQKPMALTLADAERIIAAVERAGVRFTMAWQMRVDPQNLQMRELVKSGTIGRVYQVRRRHCLPTNLWGEGFEKSWHVKPELNRGMWADDAAHAIDWMMWMFGVPQTVTAEIATLRSPKVPDDNGFAVFRYADGMMGEVSCSFVQLAGENNVEIVGERGVIVQNFGDLVSCSSPRMAGAPGVRWILAGEKEWHASEIATPASHGERIAGLAGPLLEFLQGKREAIATAREGRDALKMVLASYRAAELGRRVAIHEIGS